MVNFNELTGSSINKNRLLNVVDCNGKASGNIISIDYTHFTNLILRPSGLQVDESFYRIVSRKDRVYDIIKNKIIARVGDIILVYSRICSKEFQNKVILHLEYKCKFDTELEAQLFLIESGVSIGRYFIHSKSGNLYQLISEGKGSEDLDELVVYKAMYGDKSIWVRPRSMFFGEVEINGELVPRFKEVTYGTN